MYQTKNCLVLGQEIMTHEETQDHFVQAPSFHFSEFLLASIKNSITSKLNKSDHNNYNLKYSRCSASTIFKLPSYEFQTIHVWKNVYMILSKVSTSNLVYSNPQIRFSVIPTTTLQENPTEFRENRPTLF